MQLKTITKRNVSLPAIAQLLPTKEEMKVKSHLKNIKILLLTLGVIQISFAQEKSETKWWNPASSEYDVISGQAWPNEINSIYNRLPARAEKNVRGPVWELSKHSAGLSIRFWSNAKSILVKYKLKGDISMPHMPATGVSGLDLYSKSYDGKWMRSWGTYAIDATTDYNFIIDEDSDSYNKYGREYQLFLPLYNEVDILEIGVPEESLFKALPTKKEKPIVAYGTSICQGACASRPGMAWTNILERRLERPVINLGFSGNGRLEPELIDLMTEIDAKLYILDCLPNLNPLKDDTYKLTLNAVKKLKENRPNTPILLVDHLGYADELTNQKSKSETTKLNKSLDSAFQTLLSEGYTNIFLLKKEDLKFNFDMYVDKIHPNDYGMVQYANAYEDIIKEILNEPIGILTTTIPRTQSRDIATYKWEDRHQEILNLNKVSSPKICFFWEFNCQFLGREAKIINSQRTGFMENYNEPIGYSKFWIWMGQNRECSLESLS